MKRLSTSGRVSGIRPVALLITLVAAVCVALPHTADAETTPKAIRGFIYDSFCSPVEGANVTVVMKNGGTTIATHYFDESEPDGYYSITFAPAEWEVGYTVEVTAKLDTYEMTNSTTINDHPLWQFVNVTLPMTIPEFGDVLGSSAAFIVLVTIALFVVIGRKRR